jgi:hypothetical protein
MKKLMMLSAVMLLTVVCVRAETDEGMTGSCPDVKCPNGQTAMFTEKGCVCKKVQPVSASASAGIGDFWLWTRK